MISDDALSSAIHDTRQKFSLHLLFSSCNVFLPNFTICHHIRTIVEIVTSYYPQQNILHTLVTPNLAQQQGPRKILYQHSWASVKNIIKYKTFYVSPKKSFPLWTVKTIYPKLSSQPLKSRYRYFHDSVCLLWIS